MNLVPKSVTYSSVFRETRNRTEHRFNLHRNTDSHLKVQSQVYEFRGNFVNTPPDWSSGGKTIIDPLLPFQSSPSGNLTQTVSPGPTLLPCRSRGSWPISPKTITWPITIMWKTTRDLTICPRSRLWITTRDLVVPFHSHRLRWGK